MRGSTLGLWAGIYLTATMVCLWGLSRWGIGHAYLLPLGDPGKSEFDTLIGVSINTGSLSFFSGADPDRIPINDHFGARFTSFSEMRFMFGGRAPFPSWSEVAKGRWGPVTTDGAEESAVPFWAVVLLLVGGTVVVYLILRKRERKMMAGDILTHTDEEGAAS